MAAIIISLNICVIIIDTTPALIQFPPFLQHDPIVFHPVQCVTENVFPLENCEHLHKWVILCENGYYLQHPAAVGQQLSGVFLSNHFGDHFTLSGNV